MLRNSSRPVAQHRVPRVRHRLYRVQGRGVLAAGGRGCDGVICPDYSDVTERSFLTKMVILLFWEV